MNILLKVLRPRCYRGFVFSDELLQILLRTLFVRAALAYLPRYVFRSIANPAFRNVEGDDADRIAVLPFWQFVDDRGNRRFGIGLSLGAAHATEVIEHKIKVAIYTGNDRRRRHEPNSRVGHGPPRFGARGWVEAMQVPIGGLKSIR